MPGVFSAWWIMEPQSTNTPAAGGPSGNQILANLKAASIGQKITVAAAALAVISFMLPWRDAGFISKNGFQELTFFLILLFAYPVWATLMGKPVRIRFLPIVLAVVAIGLTGWYYSDGLTSIDDPDSCETVGIENYEYVYECDQIPLDFNGSGVIVFGISAVAFAAGEALNLRPMKRVGEMGIPDQRP